MAKQRNNIAKLPYDVRLKICELLDDGVAYDAIRTDELVTAACGSLGLKVHNTSILAFKSSPEFDEYRKVRRNWGEECRRRKMAAMFVQTEGGSDSIAKVATFELLNIVIRKLQDGEALDPKELSSISGALAAFERNRISASKDDARREFARVETEYQKQIAELSAKVAELSGAKPGAPKGLSQDALEKIEEAAKLL